MLLSGGGRESLPLQIGQLMHRGLERFTGIAWQTDRGDCWERGPLVFVTDLGQVRFSHLSE